MYFEIGIIKAIRSLEEVSLSDVILTLKAAGDEGGRPLQPPSPKPMVREPGAAASGVAPAAVPVVAATPPAVAPGTDLFGNSLGPGADASAPPGAPAGAELWQRTVAELQARKPIQGAYAGQGVFLDQRGSELVIGFAPSGQMAKDSLNRAAAKSAVEEILAALSGEALVLKLETRPDLVPPAPPPRPEPEARAAKAEPATATATAPDRSPESGAEPKVPLPSEEEFFNDPLIAEALTLFEARITSIKPATGAKAGK